MNKFGKSIIAAAASIVCVSSMTGCAEQTSGTQQKTPVCEDLEKVIGTDPQNIEKISFVFALEGGYEEGMTEDPEVIAEIHSRICNIIPGELSQLRTDDNGLTVYIQTGEEEISLVFDGDNIAAGSEEYTAENLAALRNYLRGLTEDEQEGA